MRIGRKENTMNRREIKQAMIERINVTLEAYVDDLNLEELVDEDILHDFLWEKDFGRELVENYVDEHTEELVAEFLEDIFEEIDTDDLGCPF